MIWVKGILIRTEYHRCMHQPEQEMSMSDEHQVPPEPVPGDDPTPDQDPTPDEDPVPDHNPIAETRDHNS
jgi:hypothetical protein